MLLSIDQYGDKKLLKDKKIKTVLDAYGYTSAKPMLIDDKNNISHKIGYVITHRGYCPLWIELFELKPAFW